MAMVYFGVPILDWVLLVLLIGLGIEAYLTTRSPSADDTVKQAKDTPSDRQTRP